MKTRNKVLLLVMCLILIGTASMMATMAYLVDDDYIVNTFTVGKVKIKLDEIIVDKSGTPTGTDRTEAGNEYHLLPGQTYTKDPSVTVLADSEECYVRMLVTMNRTQAQLDQIFGAGFLPQNFVTGWDNAVWETTGIIKEENGAVTYEFRYREAADPTPQTFWDASRGTHSQDSQLQALFTGFKVPEEMNSTELALLGDDETTTGVDEKFKITVTAHAIQAAGFGDETAAWAAFDSQRQLENNQQP
ncbi:MAG: hypothetical protein IJN72_09470 [Firmicutes bacterium]|nr:hypothetical protein [Bacillota bacterium]